MRPVYDLHGGKPKDYTDTLVAKCDECIKSLECVKEKAHDDCPYNVEFAADCAKHILREICEISKKCSDNYEWSSERGKEGGAS